MKKIILGTAIALFTISNISAQEKTNCYQKYVEVFELRGATEVKDGVYDDVIVTIRKRGFADCFLGKVTVKNGKIGLNTIQLSFIDNTYEPFNRNFKTTEPIGIIAGISKTLITTDEELINIIFSSAIKPKKKEFKRAPEPNFD